MKKLTVTNKENCMSCLQCQQACSLAFYKVNDITKACIQIVESKQGGGEPKVCVQCGKCMRTCKQGAITQNPKGVYMIDKKKCTGCGECVEACPMHVMVKAEDTPYTTKCIACGICAKACPMGILEVVEK